MLPISNITLLSVIPIHQDCYSI